MIAANSASWHPGAGNARTIEWNSDVCSAIRFPGVLGPAQCGRVIELGERYEESAGRMADGEDHRRRNRVRWITPDRHSRWLYEDVRRVFEEANRYFAFDLAGFAEPLQLVEYGPEGHIDWHLDCTRRHTSTRKLVATFHLSPREQFAGGELEFCAASRADASPEAGDVVVFPAFLPHRVTPVTGGVRRVLVAWAHGPAFR